jgi:DNA helicase-2/ATP-dependent DNA helicase PcrA
MPHPIVVAELSLLEQVRRALVEHTEPRGASQADAVAELERLREQLLSGRGADDRAATLLEYNRQEALLREIRAARERPRVAIESPYFGHLRLRENGREWDICVGKATFIAGDVSVVDWRHAPVSRLFYRYEQGDEYEEDLAGRLRVGRVAARRTVTIRDAVLRRVEAPEGVFTADPQTGGQWSESRRQPPQLAGGERAALRVYEDGGRDGSTLGGGADVGPARADKHLPDIAGLIDPRQFELIASPSGGLLFVRGTAGSGKTTVALHRIAYLAYADERVDSQRTLVVVFSRALRDYVSHVLPALGVRRVRVCTFAEWVDEQRRRHFPMLPRTMRDDAPMSVRRLKGHSVMLAVLAEQVRRSPGRPSPRQALDDWGSALADPALLGAAVARHAATAFTTVELERAAQWCGRRYRELLAHLAGEESTAVEIGPEDDALLLRAYQLRVGPLRGPDGQPLQLRHVAIDEAQDLSPLDVQVLLDCLDEQRSMTVAGDTQQQVLLDAGFASWGDFFRPLGLTGAEVNTLRVSYRSTHEIVTFAQAVLGDLREDESPPVTTRSGPAVELFRFTDHGACVAMLAAVLKRLAVTEPLASVALISPSTEVGAVYYRALDAADVPGLSLVEDQRFRFAPGVEICEVADVKGLEFDYVVVLEASATHYPDAPSARRRLHIAATRAIHQLWLTSVATPSPILRAVVTPAG